MKCLSISAALRPRVFVVSRGNQCLLNWAPWFRQNLCLIIHSLGFSWFCVYIQIFLVISGCLLNVLRSSHLHSAYVNNGLLAQNWIVCLFVCLGVGGWGGVVTPSQGPVLSSLSAHYESDPASLLTRLNEARWVNCCLLWFWALVATAASSQMRLSLSTLVDGMRRRELRHPCFSLFRWIIIRMGWQENSFHRSAWL